VGTNIDCEAVGTSVCVSVRRLQIAAKLSAIDVKCVERSVSRRLKVNYCIVYVLTTQYGMLTSGVFRLWALAPGPPLV